MNIESRKFEIIKPTSLTATSTHKVNQLSHNQIIHGKEKHKKHKKKITKTLKRMVKPKKRTKH